MDQGSTNAQIAEATEGTSTDDQSVNTVNSASISRQDLDEYLAQFGNATGWTYGERSPGELAGTWASLDGDGHQLVFNAGGSEGAFSESFNGKMTSGLYAISPEGKIVAFSKSNDVGVGSHFKLAGETIIGPKGPNPNAQWQRVDPER